MHLPVLLVPDFNSFSPHWMVRDMVTFGAIWYQWNCKPKKKIVQPESWELSVIWGETRTWSQETASRVALRNCSEEVKGGDRVYKSFCNKGSVLGKKKYLQKTRFTETDFIENQFQWEDIKVWAYWNDSFDMHLSHKPVFFISFLNFPQGSPGHPWGWLLSQMTVTSLVSST